MRWIFTLIFAFSLAGCTFTSNSHQKLRILFQSNRFLELQPCGCSLAPLGGIEREWNFLEQVRKETSQPLYLISGTTFTKEPGHVLLTSELAMKASFLAEALQKLKVDAIGLTQEDLSIGLNTLKQLETEHHLPLVSSDLVDKKGNHLFPPFLELKRGNVQVLVLALTTASSNRRTPIKELNLLPPKLALEKVLKNRPPVRNEIVVLLTNVDGNSLEKALSKDEKIHLVLGGAVAQHSLERLQPTPHQIRLNAQGNGKFLADLSLDLNFPLKGFYNAAAAAAAQKSMDFLSTITSKQMAALPFSINHWVDNYAQIPLKMGKGLSHYDVSLVSLNNDLEKKPNPMSDILERYLSKLNE